MNLTDLGYFLHVAHGGSFARAANLAHVSPPAISKAIQRLEEDLGASLFCRTTRSVALTDAGQLLLERGERLVRDVEDARHAIEQLTGTMRGPLRVAAMEVFSIQLVPQAIATLTAEADAVEPHLYEMLPHLMTDRLDKGQLDIAFTIGGHATNSVACQCIGTSPGVLVCGRGHALYKRGVVTKTDLQRHAFVVPAFWGQPTRPSLDQFDDVRYPRRIGATIELLQSAVELAVSGRYLLYVPEITVRRQLAQRRLKALTGLRSLPPFELQALTRRASTGKNATARLLEIVTELVSRR
jgi:DNA-binding transcriptional LysR family regulator